MNADELSEDIQVRLINIIHEIMRNEQVSQTELARRIDTTSPYVNQLLSYDAKKRLTTFKAAAKVLAALGYRLDLIAVSMADETDRIATETNVDTSFVEELTAHILAFFDTEPEPEPAPEASVVDIGTFAQQYFKNI